MNNKTRRVRINPKKNFDNVIGADSVRRNWPALETDEGVIVRLILRRFAKNEYWYIWNTETDWVAHDSAFFTDEDMEYLIIL